MSFILADRVHWAFSTFPDAQAWGFVLLLCLPYGGLAFAMAHYGGLLDYRKAAVSIQGILITFFIPSLLEETIFRVLMNPHPKEAPPVSEAIGFALLSNVIYVAWHPLNAWLLTPLVRPIFYNAWFLTICAVLGFVSQYAYYETGSVWPATGLHWLTVATWYTLGGKANLGI